MLIPVGHEDQRVTRLPWATIGLIVVNVAVFLATFPIAKQQADETRLRLREVVRFARDHPYLRLPEELSRIFPVPRPLREPAPDVLGEEQGQLDRLVNDFQTARSGSLYRTFGYIPAEPHPLSLFTLLFIHGGWLHLLGNMLFLWLSGTSLEDRWGRIFFLALYLASGVAGTLAHAAVHPQSTLPLVGASGAIAGLMGAFLIRLATTRIRFLFWFIIFRGTFSAPAYVVLPLWLLQQFMMARTGPVGLVAVWAHIGGFGLGVVAALLIRLTDLEEKVLAPAVAKKTTWTASDRLTGALGRLDRGDLDGAINELEALLRVRPDNIEARTSLIDAYARKGDEAAAGRESARLVGAYLKARDMAGATAAFWEHKQSHPEVPLAMRDLLALAAHREKLQEYHEAADLYRTAVAAWPDDPLAPKALVGCGRLQLQIFKQPEEALEILQRARTHPRATAEFQQASGELIAAATREVHPAPQEPPASPPAPEVSSPKPQPHQAASEVTVPKEPAAQAPAGTSDRALAPISARAVGIDARGLHLQDRRGGTVHLAWQRVRAVSVASLGRPEATGPIVDSLILDLVIASNPTAAEDRTCCIRLSNRDLAIPQLQSEPSPLRAFQRLIATILKVTGATPHPSREACLGLQPFPVFPDVAAYEADLRARLAAHG